MRQDFLEAKNLTEVWDELLSQIELQVSHLVSIYPQPQGAYPHWAPKSSGGRLLAFIAGRAGFRTNAQCLSRNQYFEQCDLSFKLVFLSLAQFKEKIPICACWEASVDKRCLREA